MYSNMMKLLKPKPNFNLRWYKGEDLYSEGEIEDKIVKLIAENEPEDYTKAIYENFNWSTYYHLTHIRKNILNWYPFEKDSSVLEIGCGMGAITNMLCEKCGHVTAVELSKKRATAALFRCREKENLEIIVGNLNDITFDKKFDYITLIGVLEYQGQYTDTENPYRDFLSNIKQFLKPNGKLLIGIENKYGVKYWCGAKEDHTGIPFDGMNQYMFSKRKVRTFSKAELEILVKESGFKNTYFYYPMPDYKLPTVIYSEKKLPENENMQNVRPYYTDKHTLIADEMGLYKDIIQNNVFEFFSNSFLTECSDDIELGKVIFASTSSERLKKYRILTRITKESKVEKIALNDDAMIHVKRIAEIHNKLGESGRKIWSCKYENDVLCSEFCNAELLEFRIIEAYKKKNSSEIFRLFDKLYDEIVSSSEHVNSEENIMFGLEIDKMGNSKEYGPILKIAYIDMISRNAFYMEGECYWFDQEWILENVPAGYVFYRALKELYQSYPWIKKEIALEELVERYKMSEVWENYIKLEQTFISSLIDQYHMAESNVFRNGDINACVNNVKKIIQE